MLLYHTPKNWYTIHNRTQCHHKSIVILVLTCIAIYNVLCVYILQKYKPREAGKVILHELVADFKEDCKKKIEDKSVVFGPKELEKCRYIYLY